VGQKTFYTPKELRLLLGVTYRTIWNWIKAGKISTVKTSTNRHLIPASELEKLKIIKPVLTPKYNIIYARVSNTKQKEDLNRQIERLSNYALINGIEIHRILFDIGSGMNFNRKQFVKLFNLILNSQFSHIIIENKDRLCRFAFEIFENLSTVFNFKITITCQVPLENESFEQELTNDLIAIIHHFSMKLYSNRRFKFKNIIKALEK